ncbi:hypothetical protein TNCV_4099161 [Trichonephila clavipes]|nr:hypothetical protein TNCV_4099161 [Trichonephila clavipes]
MKESKPLIITSSFNKEPLDNFFNVFPYDNNFQFLTRLPSPALCLKISVLKVRCRFFHGHVPNRSYTLEVHVMSNVNVPSLAQLVVTKRLRHDLGE